MSMYVAAVSRSSDTLSPISCMLSQSSILDPGGKRLMMTAHAKLTAEATTCTAAIAAQVAAVSESDPFRWAKNEVQSRRSVITKMKGVSHEHQKKNECDLCDW